MTKSLSLKRNSKSELQFISHLEKIAQLTSICMNINYLPVNAIYKQSKF
jgi:hypothetical protein